MLEFLTMEEVQSFMVDVLGVNILVVNILVIGVIFENDESFFVADCWLTFLSLLAMSNQFNISTVCARALWQKY